LSAPIRLPSGVRDFLPRAAARRLSLAERVTAVFEAWGYARIITPVFECADVLERGLGHGARAAAIRFVEPGTGEVVALRPDITPQVARLAATRLADQEGPIRLCYEGALYRLSGRLADELGQREIMQAGIELIEAPSPEGDAEVLAVAAATLAAAQLPETRLDVGHVAPVRCVLGAARNDDHRDALAAALARARAQPWPEDVHTALGELAAVLAAFAELVDPPGAALTIDLGDVRGFDYYTGVRFAGYASGAPDAVLRGGRYDELIGRYGRPARATGFAIDLEALADAQRVIGVATARASRGLALYGTRAAAIARALRSRGTRAVVCTGTPTATWLRGAGLDAAVGTDSGEVVHVDDARETLDLASLESAIELLEVHQCPS